jgi:putative membrane protein
MAHELSNREPQVWKGALAGAVAGLAASWVMTRFQVALSGRGLTGSENPQSNKPVTSSTLPAANGRPERRQAAPGSGSSHAPSTDGGPDDAAMKAADDAAQVALGRSLTREEKTEVGGPLAHYAFGVTAGAFYGMLRETEHAPGGVAFGAQLWAIADQLGLPMVGLSPWPLKAYPASTNAQHLAAHVVYGLSTAGVYSLVRRAI